MSQELTKTQSVQLLNGATVSVREGVSTSWDLTETTGYIIRLSSPMNIFERATGKAEKGKALRFLLEDQSHVEVAIGREAAKALRKALKRALKAAKP